MAHWMDHHFDQVAKQVHGEDRIAIAKKLAEEDAKDQTFRRRVRRISFWLLSLCAGLFIAESARRWWVATHETHETVEPVYIHSPEFPQLPIDTSIRPEVEAEPESAYAPEHTDATISRSALESRRRQLIDRIKRRDHGMQIIGSEIADKEAAVAALEGRQARAYQDMTAWMGTLSQVASTSQTAWNASANAQGSAARIRTAAANLRHNYEVLDSLERRYWKALKERDQAQRELNAVDSELQGSQTQVP